jgi:hypothetical protein
MRFPFFANLKRLYHGVGKAFFGEGKEKRTGFRNESRSFYLETVFY